MSGFGRLVSINNCRRSLLALGSTRGEVALWHAHPSATRPLRTFSVLPRPGSREPPTVRHTALSHDRQLLVCCCDDSSVCVWSLGGVKLPVLA